MQMPDRYIASAPSGAGMVVRSSGADASLIDAIRRASVQMSNQQVIYGMQTMDELITESLASQRFSMILLGVFALLALVLASVGIYGVISYVVGQRTQEIGLRMAIGAKGRDVRIQFLLEALILSLIGGAFGTLAGVAGSRAIANAFEWPTRVSPSAILLALGFSAAVGIFFGFYPASKAAALDPIDALRYE